MSYLFLKAIELAAVYAVTLSIVSVYFDELDYISGLLSRDFIIFVFKNLYAFPYEEII